MQAKEKMKSLSSSQKKKITKQLNEQFGISKLPYLLLKFGKEKLRAFSGNLSREELSQLDKDIRIENIGLYIAKEQNQELRLTMDGTQILKNQITKNILEIDNKQSEQWFKGNDLDIQTEKGFKILKNNNNIIGSGKSTGERITNFVPKERRIKSNS